METNNGQYEYVLFDLDGTLTNSEGGIKRCINYAMEKIGKSKLSDEVLNSMIGPPFVVSMKAIGLTDEETTNAIAHYRSQYAIDGWNDNVVYDGIVQMLSALHSKGLKLSLATSKPMCFAEKIMDYFDMTKYFVFLGAADTDNKRGSKIEVIEYVFQNLEIIDRSKVLMIGDRKYDVEGANLAGIDCGGVLWGFGDREELTNAGAKYIFEKPSDVIKFFC